MIGLFFVSAGAYIKIKRKEIIKINTFISKGIVKYLAQRVLPIINNPDANRQFILLFRCSPKAKNLMQLNSNIININSLKIPKKILVIINITILVIVR
jgi:hypothetical protein